MKKEKVYFKVHTAPTAGQYSSIQTYLQSESLVHSFLQPTPDPRPRELEFTLFQMELYGDITVIKVANSDDVGLYVDAHDGWKVKATNDRRKWSRCAFKISKFLPQDPPNSENGAQPRRMNFCAYI